MAKIEILVFGRELASESKMADKTAKDFIRKMNVAEHVGYRYHDMDTVEGMAEAASYGVNSPPTTVVCRYGDVVDKWEIVIPSEEELNSAINNHGIPDDPIGWY